MRTNERIAPGHLKSSFKNCELTDLSNEATKAASVDPMNSAQNYNASPAKKHLKPAHPYGYLNKNGKELIDHRKLPKLNERTLTVHHPGMDSFSNSFMISNE